CLLRATVDGMVREWSFSTVAITGSDWKLTLHIDGSAADVIAQRDALYRAMTNSPNATLVVRRSLTLAIQRVIFRVPPPQSDTVLAVVAPSTVHAPAALGVAAHVGGITARVVGRPIGDGPVRHGLAGGGEVVDDEDRRGGRLTRHGLAGGG